MPIAGVAERVTALSRIAVKRLSRMGATPNQQAEEDREAIREGGFAEMMRRAWSQIETDNLIWNWHHDAIAEHAEAVYKGQIKTLVVNLPPGHTKSISISVMFPSWVWTPDCDPTWRLICATYDAKLSRRDARKVKKLIDSVWWRQRFPGVSIPSSSTRAVDHFTNNRGGWRISTTPGGTATGWHADCHIIDDPIKPKDTRNVGGDEAAKLEEIRTWHFETMPTRARNPAMLRRIIMMQRLHERDLAGAVLEAGGGDVQHLMLPARFEKARACRTYVHGSMFFEDPRTVEGELLYPQRFPEEVVAGLEGPGGLGAQQAAAQLQQNPFPPGGSIFQREWFDKRFKKLPARGGLWAMSVDARFKKATDSGDQVAIGVWLAFEGLFYRVDEIVERLSFTGTVAAIETLAKRYPKIRPILVENKANGPGIADVLEKKFPGLILLEPEGGKEARAHASTCYFEAGNVLFPAEASWLDAYVGELVGFPKARFDDRVDETTQALLYLAKHSGSSMVDAMRKLRSMR